jgi:hypothetical protein
MNQKLFIGGLSFGTSTDELSRPFNQIPGVETVAIVSDRDTGRFSRLWLRRDGHVRGGR